MFVVLALAAALTTQSTPPVASPADPVPAPAPTEAERAESERMVCRREHVVGSNRPQRICLPANEWDRMREASKDERRQFNDRQRGFQDPLPAPPGS